MKRLPILLFAFCFICSIQSFSQVTPKKKGLEVITKEAIQAQLEFLASDWTEGRETGTRGIYLAGDYVASMFKYSGVLPGGDLSRGFGRRGGPPSAPAKTYFQNFTLLQTLPGGTSSLEIKNGDKDFVFMDNVDFMINRANSSANVSGTLVFVGYGIESEEFGLNDFVGVELKGKVVIRLSGFPGMNDENSEMYKKMMADRRAAYMLNRTKNDKLKELGVVAVIEVNTAFDIANSMGVFVDDMNLSTNESSRNTEFTSLSLDNTEMSVDPISVSVTGKVVKAALMNSGIDLEKFESNAAKGTTKFKPIELRNVKVSVKTEVKKRRVNVRNVVAMIEGESKDEFIVVGAHMDHMGMNNGRVWNGADDNASGTIGVMTIARAFVATGVKPKRTVLFCAWTGEEKGLLGSEFFTLNPTIGTIDQYKFYLNYDMISRDSPGDEEGVLVSVTYNKDYPRLEEISTKNATDFGLTMTFNYRAQEKPTGGSDHTAFTNQNIPIMYMMAGFPSEYHTPEDEINLINWDKMLEIIKLGFLNMWDIANSDF